MFETRITRSLGLTVPVANAGMAMVARPALAAAVSNAGGLGTIGCDIESPDALRAMVRATVRLTDRPFGVDLIGDFATDAHVDVLLEERVAVAIFFWRLPSPAQVARLHEAGSAVWMQVGSVAEADAAAEIGVDALIVQGADAVWCGTRFLASHEAAAHCGYKAVVLAADVGDTAITTVYGPEWPDQPVRAIVNRGLEGVLRSGRPEADDAPIGSTIVGGERVPLPRYSAILPTSDFEGDLDFACLTAGQGAGNIDGISGAADIVAAMVRDAAARLAGFAPPRCTEGEHAQ